MGNNLRVYIGRHERKLKKIKSLKKRIILTVVALFVFAAIGIASIIISNETGVRQPYTAISIACMAINGLIITITFLKLLKP